MSNQTLTKSALDSAEKQEVQAAAESFLTPRNFTSGDVIRLKHGMKNRRFPDYGQPVVAMAVGLDAVTKFLNTLPEGLHRTLEHETGSCYWSEANDLIIGLIRDEGDGDGPVFLLYPGDSRRFTRFDPLN